MQAAFSQTSTYYPHLSLLYANLPIERKLELIEYLQSQDMVNGVLAQIPSFKPSEVVVVLTEGPLTDWKEIARIPLS